MLDPDPELYGLLRPRDGAELDPRAVSRDTALLFLTLQAPGRLPAFAEQVAEGSLDTAIANLVLDGVLEVEHRREFVSGVDAHELLLAAAGTTARGRTVALSHAALRYGQALDRLPAETLALRLYLFGRRPLTTALRRLLPTEEAVTAALGLAPGGHVRGLLGRAWVEDPRGDGASPWRMLRRRGAARAPERHGGAKLYVSPHPEQVGESIAAVADVLGDRAGVVGFKVARDVGGLCRPDKLVCYFSRVEDLHEAVGALQPRLEGIAAHGVPFTAPIDADGLLSWGLDPPDDPANPTAPHRGELAPACHAARRGAARDRARIALQDARAVGARARPAAPRRHRSRHVGAERAPLEGLMAYTVTEPVVLPPDAALVPVEDLPEELRAEIEHRPGDHALTRPLSRNPSTIVDLETAELLEEFRTPTRIVDAVIGYSTAQQLDPTETLERAFPVLQGFMNAGLLVPADSELAQPIETSLEPGAIVGRLEIVQAAHVMVDTEVYLATTAGGRRVAVKLARAGFEARLAAAFEHEASVLRLLDGSVTPVVVEQGEHDGRPFLALSWCDGVDVHEAAAEARSRGPAARDDLLGLVQAILDAYAGIHEQGVLHGDVHPRNVLVDPSGRVTVIDFGLGRPTTPGDLAEPPRGGIDFFMEPELAACLLAREPPQPADARGEQYSIAALVYLLLAGAHTQRFSLEEPEMLRQLVHDPPLTFAAHGVIGLDSIERVVLRALAKDPADRFESVAAFAAAFRRAAVELEPLSGASRNGTGDGPR